MDKLNAELKQKAREMIRSGAPEREAELSEVWEKYAPEFLYSGDAPGFVLEAGPYGSLRLTDRTLCLIWMFGHIAWKTLYLYSALIHVYSGTGEPFDVDDIEKDSEHKGLNTEVGRLLDKFHEFKSADSIFDCEWPASIPEPAHRRPTDDDEQTAVFDLVGKAMVYVFLHEIKHIQFSSDSGEKPEDQVEEEMKCDEYARSFLFDEVAKYSEMSGDDLHKVISKRAMAVALASFLIFELTPAAARYGSESHPPVIDRIRHVLQFPSLSPDDNYWLYLGSILMTKARLEGAKITPFQFSSRKQFCESVFDELANHALQPLGTGVRSCITTSLPCS
jgi:hypothetical protein